MTKYLESDDGEQSYLASAFSTRKDLVEGELYDLQELQFTDWVRTAGSQHKPPRKKLRVVNY